MANWEFFRDPAYFDMWAVRRDDKRSFNDAIHVLRAEEAERLATLLNKYERARPEPVTPDREGE
jgi:hypothetical protein